MVLGDIIRASKVRNRIYRRLMGKDRHGTERFRAIGAGQQNISFRARISP
jgi:hypothetical protein